MLPIDRLINLNTTKNLWLYILIILKEGPIYAYKLRDLIYKKFNFRPGKITAYRVLYRLQSYGFVKSKIKERKRIYEITKKGEEELEKAKEFYQNLLKNF